MRPPHTAGRPPPACLREPQGWGAGPETGVTEGDGGGGTKAEGRTGSSREPVSSPGRSPAWALGFKAKMEKEREEKRGEEKGVLVMEEVRGQGPGPGWPGERPAMGPDRPRLDVGP